MSQITAIQHDTADMVATALDDVAQGVTVLVRCPCDTTRLHTVRDFVPFGHKFALADIAAGAPVVKYGAVMGTATADIPAGAHVHTHNVVGNRVRCAPDRS
jgi:altronate dehydratase small subunit